MSKISEILEENDQFVSFIVAEEEYGIPITKVREIIRYEKLTHVPQSAEFIEGVLNLRGRVIPVMDLRKRFCLSQKAHDRTTRIIVVEIGRLAMGITVDSVTEVRTIPARCIDSPPVMGMHVDREFIVGMGKLEDRLVILLDLERILSACEKESLCDAVA